MRDTTLVIPDFSKLPENGALRNSRALKKKNYEEKMPPLKMNIYLLDEEDILQMILKDRRLKLNNGVDR